MWHPPNLETHIASRVAIGCVLLAWLLQTVLMVWTLHGLKATGADSLPDVELELEMGCASPA